MSQRVMSGLGVLLGVFIATGAVAEDRGDRSDLPKSPAYNKPFLIEGEAAVGGYIDMEFKADQTATFDQHRFVPFIYAAVSDRVHVSSEIEFEHGGFVSGDSETDGEIKIEFAQIDFTFSDALNFRGGVVLAPLGRLNVLHDAPMLDLTERPLVDRYVIPSTLSESGMGAFGEIYPSDSWVIDYEVYAVNGFNGEAVQNGEINVRSGRGSQSSDNNNHRSVTGRLGISPRLGTEVGVSIHTGAYDDAGDNNLTITALDARFSAGAFEILGEAAMGRADTSSAVDGTAGNEGFYLEGRYHFLAGVFNALPECVFTGVVRADYVNYDVNVTGRDQERLTFGLNFRPTEETVFKSSVLLNRNRTPGSTEWSDTESGFRFSVASYF